MVNMSNVQLRAQQLARQFAEAQEAAENEQRAIEAQQAKANRSAQEVTAYLTKLVDRQLVLGNMQPKVVQAYLNRFTGDKTEEYLRLMVSILTNPYQGITSDSKQVAHSTFMWMGQEYSLDSLKDKVQAILGTIPLKGTWWWYELLHEAINNRQQLRTDFQEPRTRTTLVNLFKAMSAQQTPIKPDTSVLTADDMMLIQHLVDGKGYSDTLQ